MSINPSISLLGCFSVKPLENDYQDSKDIREIIKNARISLIIDNANEFDYSLFISNASNDNSVGSYIFKISNEYRFKSCKIDNNDCLIWKNKITKLIYIFIFQNNQNEISQFFSQLNCFITSKVLEKNLKSIKEPKKCVKDLGNIKGLKSFINEGGLDSNNCESIDISNQIFQNLYPKSKNFFSANGNFYKYNIASCQSELIMADSIFNIYQNQNNYYISVEKENFIKKYFIVSNNLDLKIPPNSNFILIYDKSGINMQLYSFYFSLIKDSNIMNKVKEIFKKL
jgi:hypothetical protein